MPVEQLLTIGEIIIIIELYVWSWGYVYLSHRLYLLITWIGNAIWKYENHKFLQG